jgi:hypothetical protein
MSLILEYAYVKFLEISQENVWQLLVTADYVDIRHDLKVCDDGTLVQMLRFFGHYPSSCRSLKRRPVSLSKHNVSETGFCLRLQVKPTQLDPIDRANPYLTFAS